MKIICVSHRSVELNISGDKQCLRFILFHVTVFGNVVVSWRESSCWLSLLKPILHDWWLAPKQVLHTIRSGHIFRGTKDQHLPSSGSCLSKAMLSSLGRVKLPVIRVDGILASFQEGGLFEGVIRRCTFAVTDHAVSRLELAVER